MEFVDSGFGIALTEFEAAIAINDSLAVCPTNVIRDCTVQTWLRQIAQCVSNDSVRTLRIQGSSVRRFHYRD